MGNLDIYNKVKEVPQEALSEIKAGRLKGKSNINAQWRIYKLTEMFGVCGFGWKYKITRQWIEEGASGERTANVNIELFIKVDGEWSEAIPGTGGNMLITSETKGLHTSDEAYKMALTDAISVSCKALGVGADVYWSEGNKYDLGDDSEKEADLDILQKVKSILWIVSGKNKAKSLELLKEFTEFTGRDKKLVEGLTDFEKLKGGRLKTTYNKLEKKYPDIYGKVNKDFEEKSKEKQKVS